MWWVDCQTRLSVLILLEVAAIVGRQSHSSFDHEFLHQVHGIMRFGLLAIIRSHFPATYCHLLPSLRRLVSLRVPSWLHVFREMRCTPMSQLMLMCLCEHLYVDIEAVRALGVPA